MINKVKVTSQGQGHIKVSEKSTSLQFYAAHTVKQAHTAPGL